MPQPTCIFFGSFQHYSTLVLEGLVKEDQINITAVVSTTPRPAGRNQQLKKTHTHQWAEAQDLPVFTPEKLNQTTLKLFTDVLNQHNKPEQPDLFLVAGYRHFLPKVWLEYPKVAPLNLHFSLLPKFRGANPAEWAILCHETETGNTLMVMKEEFDTGPIIAQTPVNIKPKDTRESLYQKLYDLGGQTITPMLTHFLDMQQHPSYEPIPQPSHSPTPEARLLKRQDGFLPWLTTKKILNQTPLQPTDLPTVIKAAHTYIQKNQPTKPSTAKMLETATRALHGYPGLWTTVPTTKGKKRLKILSGKAENNRFILDKVQLEGQKPAHYNQIKTAITV